MANAITTTDPAPYQGEPRTLSFTVRNSATSAVVNITGWSIVWRLSAPNPTPDQENLLSIDAVLSGTPTDGTFTVSLPATATQRAAGKYVFEIRRTDVGSEETLARGQFTVKDSAFYAG
jgi:hypothetical protein